MILQHAEYKPAHLSEFWCHQCDSKVVSSDDLSTGKFFLFSGHAYRKNVKHSKESGHYDGEYHIIMCAYCSDCLAT